jgi:hypothetical protein
MLTEHPGPAPDEEVITAVQAIVRLFAAVVRLMPPEDRDVLALGLVVGTFRPRFTLEANGTVTGEIVLSNGEKITLFQTVSPAVLARDILN